MTTLFHYTTSEGLKGIIESRSFWASDNRFLNDSSEFYYGFQLVEAELERRKGDLLAISEGVWNTLESWRAAAQKSGVFALVASFTTEGDLLSQWRGYNGGRGFSLGIDQDWLVRNARNQGFQHFPVIYASVDQKIRVERVVQDLIAILTADTEHGPFDILKQWWPEALKTALAIKD